MQRIAVELGLDPLDVIRRNLVAAGRVSLSHRDRRAARFRRLSAKPSSARVERGRLRRTEGAPRRGARAEGRLYGIGFTAVVEPSVSNMGYITTVLTPAERRKAGPKNGAQATATVSDRSGRQRSPCMSPPCRKGRAIAPCWRRSSPTCFGLTPRGHPRQHRDRHRQGRLVDRVRQLCQPLCAGGRRHGEARGRARCAAGSRASPRSQLNVEADEIVFADGFVALEAQSGQRGAVLARSPRSAIGRRARCPTTSARRSARPCSGRRRN